MSEELYLKTLNDKRVEFSFKINKDVYSFRAIPKDMKKIIIYCHGLGSDRTWAMRFYDRLYNENIGIISYDLPGHGDDKDNYLNFNIPNCLNNLESTINYVKKTYRDIPIILFGSSFGGYLVLNRLRTTNNDIEKVLLMCPGINFSNVLLRKSGLPESYLDTVPYVELFNKIRLTKEIFNSFKDNDAEIDKYNYKQDISIIQGDSDKTVPLDDITKFSLKNNIDLKIIENATHELHKQNNEICDFIIDKVTI